MRSPSTNHLKLKLRVHWTQMTVTSSQLKRAPLGCGGTGDSLYQLTNLQELCDSTISRWTKILEYVQYVVESMPFGIKVL